MSDVKQSATNSSNGKQDPTRNTREMVQDAIDRINDLAAAENRSVRALADAETRRVNEIAALRERYDEKLALAEAGRLNAIRIIDENARIVDREKAATQASLLATDVKTTAETARLLVAQTAEGQTRNLDQRINPILEKIAVLEQARFQGVGERRVADPAQVQLETNVRALLTHKENVEGRAGLSQPMLMAMVAAAAAFLSWMIQSGIQ